MAEAAKKTAAAKKAASTATEGESSMALATEVPTVYEAWSNVMEDVQFLGKNQRYDGGEGGGRFNYRGIDDLMNAVGPILRKHRISIIPSVKSASYRDVTTRGGKTSREVTVTVNYATYGPGGDVMYGTSCGEALDTSDKGTAKAMSVAFRVYLLQSLCLPTNEPDPDSQAEQRAGGKTPGQIAQETADRVPTSKSVQQLEAVKRWAAERGLLDESVNDSAGNSRPLLAVIDEKIEEMAASDPQVQAAKQAQVDRALGGQGNDA